jgi:hypothetical protein
MAEPLSWLDDAPLQCGYFPQGERCENETKMVAFGANNEGRFFWFPICQDCSLIGETHSWQVANPFGMHESDRDVE